MTAPRHNSATGRSVCYLAAAPTLGVRPQREAGPQGQLRLLAGDIGGRGFAMRAVLVRVRQQGLRYTLDTGAAVAGRAPWPAAVTPLALERINGAPHDDGGQGEALYAMSVAPDLLGPPEQDCLLLLILRQGPGGADPGPALRSRFAVSRQGVVDGTVAAISALLSSTPSADLRRFRVQRPAAPAPGELCFAFGSCQYTSGMVDDTSGRDIGRPDPTRDPVSRPGLAALPSHLARPGPADASYQRLAALLDEPGAATPRPSLLLLLGDQVYVDGTAGLFDPALGDGHFRVPYEHWLGSPCVQEVLSRLPLECVIDDHEIVDNWEPDDAGPRHDAAGRLKPWAQLRHDGANAFRRFQLGRHASPPGALWRHFDHHGLPFFLMDTRTEREHRDAHSLRDARLVDELQFQALCDWLQRHRDEPKFIASPSILLPRQRTSLEHEASALRSDAWDGYPATFHRLLAFLCDERIRHCVFLSGDEHLSCLAEVTLQAVHRDTPPLTLHSIHCSGFYSPYPFANALPEDLAGDESFSFHHPQRPGDLYRCEVRTWFPDCGDGFATIGLSRNASGHRLALGFHGRRSSAARVLDLD